MNEYLYNSSACPHCGRRDPEIKIGTWVSGYVFTFSAFSAEQTGLDSFRKWVEKLSTGGVITDDGGEVTLEEFKATVERTRGGKLLNPTWVDEDGFPFS